ncbi:FRG domain-containing protein [Marinomonas foliarum]|uniref:FRG domain-containing protein n=1 Tax=Marinomonas foliarum TaxID=491950 RepID=A0A369AGY5_9GAMM|nr:FRG domain-containing protein [Marinomonas foliarum]RCX08355.1 FRG domain-containing protein [Marinomonas foliarum]
MKLEKLEGKKIFSLDMYLDFITKKEFSRIGLVEGNKDYAVDIGSNQYRIMPLGEGEFSPIYYRGQNHYHSPCKPSIFRPDIDDLSLIRRYEFERILKKVRINNLVNHYLLINDQHSFSVEVEGLCQHYELPTSLLDVSKNKSIAKFFAMCEFKDGHYFPRKAGNAYIYKIDLTKVQEKDRNKICLIGNQPLPRSKEQSGIAIKLNKDEDFNLQSFVSLEKIEFTTEEAIEIFNEFKNGTVLFPKDSIKLLIDEILLTISNESLLHFSVEHKKDFYAQFKRALDKEYFISNDYYTDLLKSKNYKNLFFEIENYIKSNMLEFGIRGWSEHFEG